MGEENISMVNDFFFLFFCFLLMSITITSFPDALSCDLYGDTLSLNKIIMILSVCAVITSQGEYYSSVPINKQDGFFFRPSPSPQFKHRRELLLLRHKGFTCNFS